ncbi:acyl carrier protein [Teredinibacter haidensis]|uniref:acyl carrier protein n=1 Tax=Teredinibacter haidensis TaxID=2731755 RepID=UPI00094910FA|nr:acyl carrier protein [Teredinibacter haidensis]
MFEDKIKEILSKHGKLSSDVSTLTDTSDLYAAGLTSLTTVNVMLAIEDAFDVEFEDRMLNRQTFQSIDALIEALEELNC